MKTKNMRKKALLSSVAMLLVAVVALGGATYAWFTTSSSISATGVRLTTEAASNLQIHAWSSTDTAESVQNDTTEGAWANTVDLEINQQLTPMSSSDGVNFFTIETTAEGQDAPTENTFVVTAINGGSPVEAKFWVRTLASSTPSLKVTAIKRTDNNATIGDQIWNGLRCSVKVGSTLKYVTSPSGSNVGKDVLAEGTSYTSVAANRCTVGDLYAGAQIPDGEGGTVANTAATNAGVEFEAFSSNAKYVAVSAYPTTGIQAMVAGTAYLVTVSFWLEGNTTTGAAMNKDLNGIAITLGT